MPTAATQNTASRTTHRPFPVQPTSLSRAPAPAHSQRGQADKDFHARPEQFHLPAIAPVMRGQ